MTPLSPRGKSRLFLFQPPPADAIGAERHPDMCALASSAGSPTPGQESVPGKAYGTQHWCQLQDSAMGPGRRQLRGSAQQDSALGPGRRQLHESAQWDLPLASTPWKCPTGLSTGTRKASTPWKCPMGLSTGTRKASTPGKCPMRLSTGTSGASGSLRLEHQEVFRLLKRPLLSRSQNSSQYCSDSTGPSKWLIRPFLN